MTVFDFHKMLRHNAAKAKDDWVTPDEYVKIMESCTHVWNEDACAGYILKALECYGVDKSAIVPILGEFYIQLDEVGFEDAAIYAKQYLKAYYDKKHGKVVANES